MFTIIIFILILGLLIFVHELGHFLTAIRNGVKADEFGFGFPPRIIGFVKDEKTGKYKIVPGNKELESKNTIYSLNWIPLGGFVKIKGESGENKDSDSLVSKSAWIKTKILSAGVLMNFILAWFLLTVVFIIGAPESIDDSVVAHNAKVQIAQVVPGTPAEKMGILIGDTILKIENSEKMSKVKYIKDAQEIINESKGEEIILTIDRGSEILKLKGVPRKEYPDNQGSLGISLARTTVKSYPWYESLGRGLTAVGNMIYMIFATMVAFVGSLFSGKKMAMDVAGPVGIAFMTKQVTALGLVYLLQFTAILSINLGIINALPFPALDGGRIFFILIEKIKGSPVNQKVEQIMHTLGFFLLITLMVVVTFRDFIRFEILNKIISLF